MPRCSAPRRSRTSRSHESADRDGDLEVRTRNLQIPRPDLQSFRCRAESCERRRQPLSGDMLRFVKLDQTREFACTARRKFRSDQWPAAIVDFFEALLGFTDQTREFACTARRKFRSGQLPAAIVVFLGTCKKISVFLPMQSPFQLKKKEVERTREPFHYDNK